MNDNLRFFFGSQADYYTDVAEDLDAGKLRFNEGAFFLGMFWMAYRKMYANAAITFGFFVVEGLLEDWLIPELSQTKGYILGSGLVIASVLGTIGNRLYINFARQRVSTIASPAADLDPDTITQLRKAGGTSWTGPLVLLLVFIAVVSFTFWLTM